MANVNTARSTVGSVLGAVSSVADATAGLVGSLGNGAEMVNATIDSLRQDQADRIALHRKTYRTNLLNRTAVEQTEEAVRIAAFRNQSEDHAKAFDATLDDLKSVFAD